MMHVTYAMQPDAIRAATRRVNAADAGQRAEFRAFADANPDGAPLRLYSVDADGVATVVIEGPIEARASLMGFLMGGCTYGAIVAALRMADADPAVSSLRAVVDSPGGTVTGAAECFESLQRLSKPLHVHALNMNSAALWVFCGADHISASETATVGSVGVYGAYCNPGDDEVLIISAQSPDKIPDLENPEHIEQLRAVCDAQCSVFIGDVARGRGVPPEVVAETYGKGASLSAADALERGMIDEVAREIPQQPVTRQGVKGMAHARAEAPGEPAVSMDDELKAAIEELEALKARNAELEEELAKAMEPEPEPEPEEEEDPKVAALTAKVAELEEQARAAAEAQAKAQANAWADSHITRGAVRADDVTRAAMVDAFLAANDGVTSSMKAHFDALPDNAAGVKSSARTIGGGGQRHEGIGYEGWKAHVVKASGATTRDEISQAIAAARAANPTAYHAAVQEGAR